MTNKHSNVKTDIKLTNRNISKTKVTELINLKIAESAIISQTNYTIKQHPAFFHISPNLADIILLENNIEIDNG